MLIDVQGHHGVLCGACDSDFGHTGVGECTKCQVTWWYIIVLVVTRCLSLVLVIATLKGNMTSEDDDLESTDTYYPLGTFRMRDLEMYSTWARQRGLTSAVSVTEDEVGSLFLIPRANSLNLYCRLIWFVHVDAR